MPIVALAFIAIAVLAAWESVSGLTTVARTATGASALLLLLTVVAVVTRMAAAHRSEQGWPRALLRGLALVSVALVVAVLLSTVRAHTASGRFADEVAKFPLPSSYDTVPATADVDPQFADEPEHAMRVWSVPAGADACRDIEAAYAKWTDKDFSTFTRGDTCTVRSKDSTDHVDVTSDGSNVVVEMWLEGSTLIHF